MSVQLTPEECEILLQLVNTRLGELREEIHHARVSSFSDELKTRAQVLRELIAKLESMVAV